MSQAEQLITSNLDVWTSAIKNKASTGRGSNKKQELYGIKKMRELILELAVRGLLVSQDPADEPASVLLEKIAAEKEQLIKDGKIKKHKKLPLPNQDSQLFELPTGWQRVQFGKVAEIERGGSPRPIKSFLTDDPDGLNWIKIGDTEQGGKYITSANERIRKEGLSKTRMVYPGDFLLTNSMSFGRPYITKIEGCIHDGWLRISPPASIDKDYLYLLLSSPFIVNAFKKAAAGAVVLNLNADKVREVGILIPPEAEQPRIVAKVNELMALCDQLEQETETSLNTHQTLVETLLKALLDAAQSRDDASVFEQAWQRIAEHFDVLFTTEHSIDQLKQTILQIAVMGKLVPQDPNDEPASMLLEKITAEKERLVKEGKIKKQKKLPPISEEEKPFELPVGWEWCRIGEASIRSDYGLSDKSEVGGDGVPVLAMGHIQEGKVLLGGQKTVPPDVESLPELYLEDRDLLYNRTNSAELVGKTGIYVGSDSEYTFASYLIRIRSLKESVMPEFINLNMLTPKFRETQIVPHLKQQCGQANVNGTIMKNMLVAIAPGDEQARIMKRLNELLSVLDALKENIKTMRTTEVHLADAMAGQALA